MGWITNLSKVFSMPKTKDITEAPKHIREEMQKGKMNTIDVLYIDQDFKAGDQVTGELLRRGRVTMVNLKNPAPLSFFKVKGSTIFNRTTGRELMLAVEGYPYGLQIDRQLEDEQANDYASGIVGKDGYQLPVLIDKLPYFVHKKKAEEHLRSLLEDDYFELTPDMLNDLGNCKLTDGVTEEDQSGKAVIMIVGIFMGMALLSMIQAFATGG